MISEQLILDLEEKVTFDFDNYDWLKGYSYNLILFFEDKLKDNNLKPHLRRECIRRLKELERKVN